MAMLADLVRAAHAGPSVVVTTAATLLAAGFGGSPGELALVASAVLAGQLSIGWSNDALDADRDRCAGRGDKPAATGTLGLGTLRVAVAAALVAVVALSLLLGPLAAAVHLLLVVAMGWAYNLGLKSMILSPLPYAVAFGSLPSVACLAVRGDWAPPWLAIAASATGVAAHIANCLPDLDDDRATGVRGLPHRLGEPGSRRVAAAVLALAVAAALSGAHLPTAGLLAVVAATIACVTAVTWGRRRTPFLAIMGLAVLVAALAAEGIA